MKNIKGSRSCSFMIITVVYLLAAAAGIAAFKMTPAYCDILRFFIADSVATVVVWFFGVLLKNSSVYDPYWSVAPVVILTLLAFRYDAFDLPSLLLLTGIWVWGVRLTANWAYTFENLTIQDWRYDKYKNDSKRFWPVVNFFGINYMPTVIVFLAMVPAFELMTLHSTANVFTWLAFLLMIAAAMLQYISDRRAHAFRKSNAGQVCDTGLWRYSRHPNYLGEIMMWWGVWFVLMSVAPSEWRTMVGALANTLLFVFISIPLMEKRQLALKPAYAAYKKRTSMLIPLPPRKGIR